MAASTSHLRGNAEKGSRCKSVSTVGGRAPVRKTGPESVTKLASCGAKGQFETSVRRVCENRTNRPAGKNSRGEARAESGSTFPLTKVYEDGRNVKFADLKAMQRFNSWVVSNASLINPGTIRTCRECGHTGLTLCEHRVEEIQIDEHPGGHLPELIRYGVANYYPGHANNHDLCGFENEGINDDFLIIRCYNYITMNMQTSYLVSGVESRSLRLAHCHRLMLRWLDSSANYRRRAEEDTQFKARCMNTVQRACDNAENGMLYAYTDPSRGFGRAWLPEFLLLFVVLVTFVGAVIWWGSFQNYSPGLAASTCSRNCGLQAFLGGNVLSCAFGVVEDVCLRGEMTALERVALQCFGLNSTVTRF